MEVLKYLNSEVPPRLYFSIDAEELQFGIHPFVRGIIQDDALMCVYYKRSNDVPDYIKMYEGFDSIILAPSIEDRKDAVFMNLNFAICYAVEYNPAIEYYFIINDDEASFELTDVISRKIERRSIESQKKILMYEGGDGHDFTVNRVFYPHLDTRDDPWDIRSKITPEFGYLLHNPDGTVGYSNRFILMIKDDRIPPINIIESYSSIIAFIREVNSYDALVKNISDLMATTSDKVDLLSQYLVLTGSKYYSYPELRNELKNHVNYMKGLKSVKLSAFNDIKISTEISRVYSVGSMKELIEIYPTDVIHALKLSSIDFNRSVIYS